MPETDEQRFKRLDAMRGPAKVTNYSALYNVGVASLSRNGGMPMKEAEAFLKAFWDMNWSIKQVAKEAYVRTLKDGSMWVKNPVSGFFYSLRNDRDTWSTLNQGTGVFIFDSWLLRCRNKGVVFSLQMHDEHLSYIKIGNEHRQKQLLEEAMKEVNDTLKLNVEITSDIQFGPDYASVH